MADSTNTAARAAPATPATFIDAATLPEFVRLGTAGSEPAPTALADEILASLAAVLPALPRWHVEALAEMAVTQLDDVDGDPGDSSYAEWHTLPAKRRRAGHVDGQPIEGRGQRAIHEDSEDDDRDQCLGQEDIGTDHRARGKMGFGGDRGWHDPEADFCLAGDDRVSSGPVMSGGIYGFAYCASRGEEIGEADDAEIGAQPASLN